MKILQVNSSARVDGSHSSRLASAIAERVRTENPGASLMVRDLSRAPHPVLDQFALGALFTAAEQRTVEQAARRAGRRADCRNPGLPLGTAGRGLMVVLMGLQLGRSAAAVQAILFEPQPSGRFGAMDQLAGM